MNTRQTVIARQRHIDAIHRAREEGNPYHVGARVMFEGRLSRIIATSDRPGIITVQSYAGTSIIGTSHSELAPAENRGYGPVLARMVEEGRISVRRAEELTEAKIDGSRVCPLHGEKCEAWT